MTFTKYKLAQIADFIGGSQPPKSIFSKKKKEGYVRLIQIRDYKTDNYKVYIPKSSTKKFCTEDDVMIGRYGPPVFQILRGLSGAYNVALIKATPKQEVLTNSYLYWLLQTSDIQHYIISISQRSAGQSGVNKNALENYSVLIPPLSEQQRIVAKLDTVFERLDQAIQLVEENIKATRELWESALAKVFEEVKNSAPVFELKDLAKKIESGFACSKKNEVPNGSRLWTCGV
jgi:type I restriction enzyme S subunit